MTTTRSRVNTMPDMPVDPTRKGTAPRAIRVNDNIWTPAAQRAAREGTNISEIIRLHLETYGGGHEPTDGKTAIWRRAARMRRSPMQVAADLINAQADALARCHDGRPVPKTVTDRITKLRAAWDAHLEQQQQHAD